MIVVPSYVWISVVILLFIKEIRYWVETILSFEEQDDDFDSLPESVKHMFS